MSDYYDILGVGPDASAQEIKSAFRCLAKQYHPDRSDDHQKGRFLDILSAYETLSDTTKRALYDRQSQYRSGHRRPPIEPLWDNQSSYTPQTFADDPEDDFMSLFERVFEQVRSGYRVSRSRDDFLHQRRIINELFYHPGDDLEAWESRQLEFIVAEIRSFFDRRRWPF
ncbi:DnaJ domain-containing protein [candidate division CSSED10-310 bacterium]|uniref:DnaJ domain-containing protein n=1 Tax=candidate division CSSED10-310 bacterium TaxID=2855610 RepID=A0ABV6YW74_UNCC1